ncbi:LamG domain-containing protein [Chryseobacterium sp. SC28]|uniref:LamG domain-containing protein n=1 Tax=Chryseobacterium sp. SC28 TaxID=2268028 RepID=UPI000F64AE13|nr:LamG domain-containing protein [Chryseobacterium sp. SC28]RRQ46145.1 LamG domain-containing protein [Chryseobacterium sp. SC28]
MKNIIKLTLAAVILLTVSIACSDGYIDDISHVAPGEDVAAPVITINSPAGNVTIPFTDVTTDFNFDFKVSDDIEIAYIEILVDGTFQKSYNSFVDYRNYADIYTKNLGLGNHTFTVNAKDLTGKTSTKTVAFNIDNKYTALYGEKFYLPFFAGNVFTELLSGANPTVVGNPSTIADGKSGAAYQGATDSYLTFPLSGLYSSDGISFTFWYKINATPDRAGIITINDNSDNTDENRNGGLRLFREGSASSQTIKMNVGTGGGESWNDGGNLPVDGNWVHVGVTVSPTESKIYFNGVLQRTATYTTFDFSSSSTITIASGAPSFTYWSHLSDLSLIDELRIYDKALDAAEISATMQ